MRQTRLDERFFKTTRGRILKLLCFSSATVSDLATQLSLTNNAIRVHLAALERDGLVRQSGSLKGVRKPTYVYELTEEGQQVFPKAYGPVLLQILDVLEERLRPAAASGILREAGKRLARGQRDQLARLDPDLRLAKLMDVLGPLAELERDGHNVTLRGCGCPLAAIVTSHPQVCRLAAALLSEVLGVRVRERCDREGSARCRFQIPRTGGDRGSPRTFARPKPRR